MFIEFDNLGRIKNPSIMLCNPNGNELEAIDGTIIEPHFTLRFNSMSELSFIVPKRKDNENVPWYDLIVAKRLVKVENIGVFAINNVVKLGDGLQETKEVTAFSLEVDLNYKKLNLLSGIYKFYNATNPTDDTTLIGKLMSMSNMRAWSVGYVSSSLWNKVRSYNVSDQTIYNFLMTTVEETMECIVVYDTFNKTINFYDTEEAVTDTDIYLSYDNLIKELSVEEMSDELVTALHCYGGGELDIRAVNPLGDVVIYNFDHFIRDNEEWLTDALKTKIVAWQNLQKSVQTQFANLLTQYRNKNSELIVLQGELATEQAKYNTIELQLKTAFEAMESTETYAIQLEQQQIVINNKQAQITTKQAEIKTIQDSIDSINNQTKISNNFTQTELKELANYIVESTYINDAFIKTSTMTPVEIQDMAQELYDLCVKVLDKLAQPRYSFTLNGVNFLFLKEFIAFSRQLKLGCSLNVDMDDGLISYPVLLELAFALDDPTDFEMTFANRLRLDKTDFRFAELFGDSVNTGNTVSIQQGNWSEFNNNYQSSVDTFMKNEFDAGAKNIVNAKNQEIKIGAFGILGQKMLENGSYSPKKFGLINNQLVFTKDNFRTTSGMFGETTTGAYGLLADILVGNLILGNELKLEGRNSSGNDVLFSFNPETGVYMKNANIIMDSGETLEKTLQDIENTTSGNLSNAITEINNNIANLENKIIEGEITIWYQPTEPLDAKAGDIWYDTGNKNMAYLAKKGGEAKIIGDTLLVGTFNVDKSIYWASLQDETVIEALDKAQSAQTTADGKIVSYYQPTMPTTGKQGDLWFDTDDKNKPYRHNGTTFIAIQDGYITDAQSTANSALGKVNGIITSRGQIDTTKMEGFINAGNNNIFLGTSTNRMKLNENGILITKNNGSTWDTAISAYGIVADAIQSGGTITGCKIVSTGSNSTATLYNSALFGTLNGTNNFILDMADDRGGSLQLAKTSGDRMEMVAQQSYTIGATDYTPSFIYSSTMLLLRSSVRVCVDGDLFVTGRICKSWNGGFKSGDYVEL